MALAAASFVGPEASDACARVGAINAISIAKATGRWRTEWILLNCLGSLGRHDLTGRRRGGGIG
jgi:hypothetical protein